MKKAEKNILIIEDDVNLTEALEGAFEAIGFKVKISSSGEDGLKSIEESVPDVLLLDLLLPGISGLDVLEQLKEKRKETKIPVIMLSNVVLSEELEKAKEYGIEDYLVKSDWKMDDIIKKVKKATSHGLF